MTTDNVLSPLLFAIYMDDLLVQLADSGVGCFMGVSFCGAVCYGDDLTHLATCPAVLRLMLRCCDAARSMVVSMVLSLTLIRHNAAALGGLSRLTFCVGGLLLLVPW